MFRNLIAAGCALLLAASAQATQVRSVKLAELVDRSELIVFGRIELSQVIDGDCGVRYVVRIDEAYKGNLAPGGALLFSSDKPLATGQRYVLFLSQDAAAFEPIMSTNTFGPGPDPERVRLCNRNRPRYTVNIWGKGAFKVTGTNQSSSRMAHFDDVMILMPEGAGASKVDPESRYDLYLDDARIDFQSLRTLLKARPGPRPRH
jgi:hypothetical protein